MLLWTMCRGDENVWFVPVWALVLNPVSVKREWDINRECWWE